MRTGEYLCSTCKTWYNAALEMYVCPKCGQETKACEELIDLSDEE